MTIRNITGEKFSLLLTFKAIYESQSITKAAHERGMTQSAASKHLQKLRDWMGDDLFTRTAQGMEPTDRAIMLIDQVEHIIQAFDVLENEAKFEPSEMSGKFTIATTGEVIDQLGVPLSKILAKEAPNMSLKFTFLEKDYSSKKLEHGNINLVVSVNWHAPPHLRQKRLYTDEFVCVMSPEHHLADGELTLEAYASSRHLMVAPLGKSKGIIDDVLSEHGLNRTVTLSLPDFSLLNKDVLSDELVTTLPKNAATNLVKSGKLITKPLPVRVPDINYYLFWHQRFHNDKTNRWMREKVLSILDEPNLSE